MSKCSGNTTLRMILLLTPAWSALSGVAFQKNLFDKNIPRNR